MTGGGTGTCPGPGPGQRRDEHGEPDRRDRRNPNFARHRGMTTAGARTRDPPNLHDTLIGVRGGLVRGVVGQ